MRKFTNDEIAEICSEISYLLHAGISNSGALSSIAEDAGNSPLRPVLDSMAEQADSGDSLSDIFKSSNCFPSYVCEILSVGERSGKTEETLDALSEECGNRASLDRQLKSALLYPAILMLIMLVVIAVLLIRVLPIFNDVYAQLGSGLTGVAGKLLSFGRALSASAPILGIILGAVVLFLALFASVSSFRTSVLDYWWRVKGDKGVGGQINNAHFAQALSLAISSGMQAEDAVISAAALLPDSVAIKRKCDKCLELLSDGATFTDAIKEAELLPASKCRQLDAAIKGGSADRAMAEIARRMTEESSAALNESMSRIEPIMVTFSSLLIGIILLVVMLPLVNIMSALG